MRTVLAALAVAACLPLTACSSGGPSKSPTPAASQPSAPGTSAPAPAADLALGQPARTIGSQGAGVLEITPTTVIYVPGDFATKSTNGYFAVITFKAKAMTAVAADQTVPFGGGGWQWIAPDGQTIDAGNASAVSVVPEGFDGGGPVQPGTFQWASRAFDVTPAQRGGTLIYTDGAQVVHRWRIPATDSGPQVAAVRKKLAP